MYYQIVFFLSKRKKGRQLLLSQLLKERKYYGNQYRKEAMNQGTNPIQKTKQSFYSKVKGATALWGAIEKSQRLLRQYWKNQHFDRKSKIIYLFGGLIIFSLFIFSERIHLVLLKEK